MTIGSAFGRYANSDFGKAMNVALWSASSAAAVVFVTQLQVFDWTTILKNPVWAAAAVPAVNILAYIVKQIFSDTRQDVTPL